MTNLRIGLLAPLAALGVLSACGGSNPSGPSGGGNVTVIVRDGGTGGASGATVTMTANGLSSASVTVAAGQTVTFVNNDTRSHNMTSDPHPEHDQCPEINVVGLLSPGRSRETGNMNTVRTCGFHDHDDPPPAGSRWTGSVVIR